jgi:hypothetical protein
MVCGNDAALNHTEKMKTLINTRFNGPTNTRGARVRCESWHGVTWHQFDYGASCPFLSAAKEHAEKYGMGAPESVLSLPHTSSFVA